MSNSSVSLQGYGFEIHQRDGFKCQYCGADGTKSFDTWLTLSVDHLLPPERLDREEKEYKVTACNFCNVADNHYFKKAKERGLTFDNKSRAELVEQRKKFVEEVRQGYKDFWLKNVNTLAE